VKEITGDGVRSSSNVKVLRWIENGSVKEVFQQLYQWVVVDDERYKVLKSILPTGHMDRWNAVLEGVVKEAAKTAAYDVFFEPKMVSQKAVRAGLVKFSMDILKGSVLDSAWRSTEATRRHIVRRWSSDMELRPGYSSLGSKTSASTQMVTSSSLRRARPP
jgi:hypothetical protein